MGKLIYILSDSFSGSTLLDIICGTIPGVFSSGEIVHLPWELYRDKNENNPCPEGWCSCLRKYSDCPVWTKILASLHYELGYDVFNDPYRFQIGFLPRKRLNRFEMFGERFIHFFYPFLQWRGTYTLSSRIISSIHKIPARNSWILFDTISRIFDISHVVDSSKDPVRYVTLFNMRKNDILPVILIRNLRGIVHSNIKRGKEPLQAIRKYLQYYKFTFNMLEQSKQNYLLIKYEDLIKDPVRVRQRISSCIGKSINGESLKINTHKHHLVGGNAMRYKGEITVRSNDVGQNILPRDLEYEISKEEDLLYNKYPCLKIKPN